MCLENSACSKPGKLPLLLASLGAACCPYDSYPAGCKAWFLLLSSKVCKLQKFSISHVDAGAHEGKLRSPGFISLSIYCSTIQMIFTKSHVIKLFWLGERKL